MSEIASYSRRLFSVPRILERLDLIIGTRLSLFVRW